jgi:septal ring factor EnvC (AmiA/AmiB activator)
MIPTVVIASTDVVSPSANPAMPAASLTLDRGIPHLNHKTVRSLQQSITALQSAIALMQQELLTLQAQVTPEANSDLLTQMQAKEQTLAVLQATLQQAESKLAALCP